MRILVIVVTYNGLKWLDRCLGSVRASEVPADMYVWDNDSVDGSADFVAANFPEAKLTRSADNLGFAPANNMGMRYALDKGYDYVYLLNQDAWIEPSTLGTLVSFSEAHPEYGILSPLQMTDGFRDLDKQFSKVARIPGGIDFQNRRCATPPQGAPPSYSAEGGIDSGSLCLPKSVHRIMAAHWLVPCRVLEKVGLFSELFPIYGNDDNWCDRARYHGYKIGIVPEARAVHDREYREEPKEKVIYRNYYMGSLVRLCDINRPLWERFLYVCLFTAVKAVKYGSTLPFKHFGSLCRMLPEVKISRLRSKSFSCAPEARIGR
ncbi:MAG: glycosyltransferase family 2 protein [Bacteroidales bacterium]|nr:glycosyltransferase family 2 protein [Bacteroidales bacterium]